MLLLRRFTNPTPQMHDLPIALRAANGDTICVFPADVISNIRQMENTLVYNHTMPKLLGLVAALSGEGVTYVSLALGTTLATDLPASICVVETNWYTPELGARIGGRRVASPAGEVASGGLASVLTRTSTLEQALVPTALPNLHLLPAGDMPKQLRPSMARSDALKQCLAELGERFEHIILDIPAIHSTSDAIALASLTEACCVVIRQGITPMAQVRQAVDNLQHLNLLGVVFNQMHSDLPRWMHTLIPQE